MRNFNHEKVAFLYAEESDFLVIFERITDECSNDTESLLCKGFVNYFIIN